MYIHVYIYILGFNVDYNQNVSNLTHPRIWKRLDRMNCDGGVYVCMNFIFKCCKFEDWVNEKSWVEISCSKYILKITTITTTTCLVFFVWFWGVVVKTTEICVDRGRAYKGREIGLFLF